MAAEVEAMNTSNIFHHNLPDGPCAVCGSAGRVCSRCWLDFYCGKEHQRLHWRSHKAGCGALALRENPALGRHVVAVKDVPAGTVVLREVPLLTLDGLLGAPKGELKCLSCYRKLPWHQLNGRGIKAWRQCCGCGLPVCGRECSLSAPHQPECREFQRAKSRMPLDLLKETDHRSRAALMGLRTCLALETEPRLRRLKHSMSALPADGVEEGLGSGTVFYTGDAQDALSDYQLLERMHESFETQTAGLVDWLHSVAGLRHIPREWLARGHGAAILNAISSTIGPHRHDCAALYAGLSMLEHSCAPNALHEPQHGEGRRDGETVVLTSRAVLQGEHLTLHYLSHRAARSRDHRRDQLAWRGFVCRCERCADATERGLFLGSWCCRPCAAHGRQGLMLPRPGGGASLAWECQTCGALAVPDDAPVPELLSASQELHGLLHSVDADQLQWEAFMERHRYPRGALHDTHHMLLWAKEQIVKRPLATAPQFMGEPELQSLDRRAAYCKDLLSAMRRLGVAHDIDLGILCALLSLAARRMPYKLRPQLVTREREVATLQELTEVMQMLDDPVAAITLQETGKSAKEFYDSVLPRLQELGLQPHAFHHL